MANRRRRIPCVGAAIDRDLRAIDDVIPGPGRIREAHSGRRYRFQTRRKEPSGSPRSGGFIASRERADGRAAASRWVAIRSSTDSQDAEKKTGAAAGFNRVMWWRWRESNSRPEALYSRDYMLSRVIWISPSRRRRTGYGRASHLALALRPSDPDARDRSKGPRRDSVAQFPFATRSPRPSAAWCEVRRVKPPERTFRRSQLDLRLLEFNEDKRLGMPRAASQPPSKPVHPR